MLQYDAKKRFSAEQVMKHEWMQNNNNQQRDQTKINQALSNMKKFKVHF